ncbi:hypothetical protein ACSLVQ_29855, partial [Klebsiella pneumoniae]|uniref:hypothetical protein n=1 Tax=Klebsiella pneumoniae TaxID=573 RepID=UPI003EE1302B
LHELTKDEQAGIASILGVRNDPAQFHLDSASVEIIDGKRVLLTNGLYKGNSVRETTAYVDADGKGSTIQEISLQAPDAAFS